MDCLRERIKVLSRTHLSISILFVLLFWNFAGNQVIFAFFVIVGTFLPDIDSKYSRLGKRKSLRIFQFFVKHRSIIHSFTFLFLVTGIILMVFPPATFGFFVGYGSHLVADGFTKEGIKPFYPFDLHLSGIMKTGGLIETAFFAIVSCVDVFLFLYKVFGVV